MHTGVNVGCQLASVQKYRSIGAPEKRRRDAVQENIRTSMASSYESQAVISVPDTSIDTEDHVREKADRSQVDNPHFRW